MTVTHIWIEFLRQIRNPGVLAFTIFLPAMMALIFGSTFDYGELPAGDGNVAMYIILGMVGYGAVMATNGIGGQAAIEQMQGWGRQLSLTPLSSLGFIATKAIVAITLSLGTVVIILALGAVIGAEAPWWVWLQSGLIAWLGSIVFALFGLAMGLLFRSEAAAGISGGALVVLGFLGNMFVPLGGTMLAIAKWTPMYGYVALVRWPLIEGYDVTTGENSTSLWQPVVNVVAWAVIFAALAVWGAQRSRGRQ